MQAAGNGTRAPNLPALTLRMISRSRDGLIKLPSPSPEKRHPPALWSTPSHMWSILATIDVPQNWDLRSSYGAEYCSPGRLVEGRIIGVRFAVRGSVVRSVIKPWDHGYNLLWYH